MGKRNQEKLPGAIAIPRTDLDAWALYAQRMAAVIRNGRTSTLRDLSQVSAPAMAEATRVFDALEQNLAGLLAGMELAGISTGATVTARRFAGYPGHLPEAGEEEPA